METFHASVLFGFDMYIGGVSLCAPRHSLLTYSVWLGECAPCQELLLQLNYAAISDYHLFLFTATCSIPTGFCNLSENYSSE